MRVLSFSLSFSFSLSLSCMLSYRHVHSEFVCACHFVFRLGWFFNESLHSLSLSLSNCLALSLSLSLSRNINNTRQKGKCGKFCVWLYIFEILFLYFLSLWSPLIIYYVSLFERLPVCVNVTDKLFTWKIRVAIFTFSPTSIFMMNDKDKTKLLQKKRSQLEHFPFFRCWTVKVYPHLFFSFFFLIIAYILTSARNPLWCGSFRLPRQPYFFFFPPFLFCNPELPQCRLLCSLYIYIPCIRYVV